MTAEPPIRVVIDTSVVFEGLTKQGGAAGLIINAWLAGLIEVCVSDDLVIDCAMNASAIVITSNLRDFRTAQASLGLQVMTPTQLITELASGESEP